MSYNFIQVIEIKCSDKKTRLLDLYKAWDSSGILYQCRIQGMWEDEPDVYLVRLPQKTPKEALANAFDAVRTHLKNESGVLSAKTSGTPSYISDKDIEELIS